MYRRKPKSKPQPPPTYGWRLLEINEMYDDMKNLAQTLHNRCRHLDRLACLLLAEIGKIRGRPVSAEEESAWREMARPMVEPFAPAEKNTDKVIDFPA